MLCDLIALTGFIIPFGHILGPLIVWMIGNGVKAHNGEDGAYTLTIQFLS